MRLRLIFFILLVSLVDSLLAQKYFTISGLVIDAKKGQHLAGANVQVSATSIGAITDPDGYFKLPPLPPADYQLKVTYMGYSERSIQLKNLRSDTVLTIKMSQDVLSGPRITITATRAIERVTPITFSSIQREEIAARRTIQDIPELLSELPSTTFYSESGTGIGYSYLSIRGFGQRRISVMINGVPQNDPEDHNVYWVDFPDFLSNVENIQVQRGAGSSFYGPPAIGGSINILTNYFSMQRKVTASVGIGSFNTRRYSLAYNSGLLKDRFVVYARASRIQTDGYRDLAYIDFKSYFLGLAYYTTNSTLRLQFYGGPIEDGLTYTGIPKEYNSDSKLRKMNYNWWDYGDDQNTIYFSKRRKDEIENFNQPHFEILHEYRLNDRLTLNNTLFYIKGYGFFDYDGSWGTPEYFRLTPEYGYNVQNIPSDALVRAYVDNKQIGWYPQLLLKNDLGNFVLGAELRAHRSLHWGRLQKGGGLPTDVVGDGARHYYEYKGAKDIASVYFHQTSRLRPKLLLMSDLQYTYKRYRLYDEKYVGNDFTVPYHFFNPRLGLNYNLSKQFNLYTNVAYTEREPRLKNLYDAAESSYPEDWGYKVPQFEVNPDGSYNFDKPLVKPEALTDFELGVGYHTNDLNLNLNYYYMNFKNEIIKSGQLDRFGQPITGNADRTRHQGVELSTRLQLTPKWHFSFNFTKSENKLVSYKVYDWSGQATDLSGNKIAGFPDVIANGRLTYNWRNWYASLQWRYQSAFYTDNYQNEHNKVDAFDMLNLDFRYHFKLFGNTKLTAQLHVANVLNKKYLAHGEGQEFFPGAPRSYFVNFQIEY
ncbi:MAG TPA: TonB-dependent receptor [Caldithrix abyssi]|uniref:TonB-dependent receptor n=1 Tax=Caldithrix abyssi TaxID=187145 RepID=A0A7V5LJS1_CALAY|nr:TonB-dependent receptor [Caldithrix abyssi]